MHNGVGDISVKDSATSIVYASSLKVYSSFNIWLL